MAILKCKMCGGDMEISADKTFGTCEYCGSTMTLPKGMEDEQRAAAFNRGNHFRRACDFDKALAVYERIVAENDADAEAHWCCALCRFGIEYVEDPVSYEYIPTCHRASFDSFLEDVDYLAAVEHSDGITRRQYQKDGAKIAEVQRGILATSQTAEPFDVFICYKETGEDGQRTRDSIMAQDIYYQLTEEGYRVFFSRITLEDVAGTQYEPYIFAALNSAKVMVAVGTKEEHFSAVWVKNEWSRFLAMMKKDRSKLLLPCYRDMDPYDLPEQLSVLQSYDMSKIGFIQDLIRGIKKVLDSSKAAEAPTHTETVVVQQNASSNVAALLKRGQMALEDGEWTKADEFFEEVLNQDAENGEAYLGKYLAGIQSASLENLANTTRAKIDRDAGGFSSRVEKKEVLCVDQNRVNAILDRFVLGAYLTRDEIKKALVFDRTYESLLSQWQQELKNYEFQLQNDKLYSRVKQFASGEQLEQMKAYEKAVIGYLNQRVAEETARDQEREEKIAQAYAEHMTQVEQKLEERRSEVIKHCEVECAALMQQVERAQTQEEFDRLGKRLMSLSFLDGVQEKIQYCIQKSGGIHQQKVAEQTQKIRQLTEERESLEKELETSGGLFGGMRRKKIEARLAQIKVELGGLMR